MAGLPDTELNMAKLQLASECAKGVRVGEDLRLYPGWNLIQKNPDAYSLRIAGTFGLVYTLPESQGGVDIAQAGFSLRGEQVIITNSPQGFNRALLEENPDEVRKLALAELRQGRFRERLVEGIATVGQRFIRHGARFLVGVSAANHPKVIDGTLPAKTAVKSMDQLYASMDFRQTEAGDYFRPLPEI